MIITILMLIGFLAFLTLIPSILGYPAKKWESIMKNAEIRNDKFEKYLDDLMGNDKEER